MSGRIVRIVCVASLAAAAVTLPRPVTAVARPPAAPPPAAPLPAARPSVAELLARLRALYVQAEEATEAYNAIEERLRDQRAHSVTLDRRLARARGELAGARAQAGRLARQQYRGTAGLAIPVRSLISGDLRLIADERHELRRAADRQGLTVRRLTAAERRADTLAGQARAALKKRQRLTAKRKKQRDRVTRRLDTIERTLATLSDDELLALRERERRETEAAQQALLRAIPLRVTGSGTDTGPGTGRGTDAGGAPSVEGDKALRYAVRQIGKPYAWGAEGPTAFDCSGLTQSAWAYAGRVIPRTSQQQWRQLPRVPLDELRPGDLVVYFANASHVAMYAGDGQVVQAPRPGSTVRVTPLAWNPVLGAVRPDAGSPPMEGYVPPPPLKTAPPPVKTAPPAISTGPPPLRTALPLVTKTAVRSGS